MELLLYFPKLRQRYSSASKEAVRTCTVTHKTLKNVRETGSGRRKTKSLLHPENLIQLAIITFAAFHYDFEIGKIIIHKK